MESTSFLNNGIIDKIKTHTQVQPNNNKHYCIKGCMYSYTGSKLNTCCYISKLKEKNGMHSYAL